ncbi:manganese catalase family protein [Methylobacterium komagatae]
MYHRFDAQAHHAEIGNLAAESSGRVLAVHLDNVTNDGGMRDMSCFLIARDTLHWQQWLALIEELGGYAGTLPIPNVFPQKNENQKFNYSYFGSAVDNSPPPARRWTQGSSLKGKGKFSVVQNAPMNEELVLNPARPDNSARAGQIARNGRTSRGTDEAHVEWFRSLRHSSLHSNAVARRLRGRERDHRRSRRAAPD